MLDFNLLTFEGRVILHLLFGLTTITSLSFITTSREGKLKGKALNTVDLQIYSTLSKNEIYTQQFPFFVRAHSIYCDVYAVAPVMMNLTLYCI